MKKVVVFGATGNTGLCCTQAGIKLGKYTVHYTGCLYAGVRVRLLYYHYYQVVT